jgi:hypothetical protein
MRSCISAGYLCGLFLQRDLQKTIITGIISQQGAVHPWPVKLEILTRKLTERQIQKILGCSTSPTSLIH